MLIGMITDIAKDGIIVSPRGMGTKDFLGWTGTLTNPRARRVYNPVRKIRFGYPAASVAWNLGMRDDVDSICWWNENGRRISDDGITFYGANYGQRWDGYLEEALELLKQDPATRRAWVPIWAPTDLVDREKEILYSREGKDVPCTVGFGLRLFDRKEEDRTVRRLDMQVVMRSQAAWGVFPYDLYLFSVLQELIANELGVRLGELHWYANSVHIYDRELPWIESMVGFPKVDMEFPKPAMDPIRLTYTEAKEILPRMEEMIRTQSGQAHDLSEDPITDEMYLGAEEIRQLNLATTP